MAEEKYIPTELNLEVSPAYLGNQRGRFMRNWDFVQTGNDKNTLQLKNLQAVTIYDPAFTLPEGVNRRVGGTVSRETNEEYTLIHNSQLNHCIYRIKDGKCQMVYKSPLLKFILDPQYFMFQGRIAVFNVCIGNDQKTFLVITDGYNRQRFICVEDAIATDSFNETLFPRFKGDYDREDLISLGVVPHTGCVGITPVVSDPLLLNKLKFTTWRFRIMYIDVYGRSSEHGNISDLYYQGDCSGANAGCLDLTFDAGGPLVQKYVIEYQKGCRSEWSRHEIVEKYKRCDKPWYQQEIREDIGYKRETNTITYRFCAEKGCVPVPDAETQRAENPLPIVSESAFKIAGVLGLAGNKSGFNKFSCETLDKIHFAIEPAAEEEQSEVQTRNITVWAMIHNPFRDYVQGIWRKNDRIVFGGLGEGGRDEPDIANTYMQYFGDPEQQGFIGYLAGTGYATVSKQYKRPKSLLSSLPDELTEQPVADSADQIRQHNWLQKFEFKNVPPGQYVFRIAGHHSKLSDANYQQTSTYVFGVGDYVNTTIRRGVIAGPQNNDREIFIDVCAKDFDSIQDAQKGLMIYDLTYPHTDLSLRNRSRVMQGYVYEDIEQGRGTVPIDRAGISSNGEHRRGPVTTDHNGFYFVAARDKDFWTEIHTMRKCVWSKIVRLEERQDRVDLWGSASDYVHGWVARAGLHVQDVYASRRWENFQEEACNRIHIRGKVLECDKESGIAGITVGITGGPFVQTNARGEYDLLIHDAQVNRPAKIIFMQTGNCRVKPCDGDCAPILNFLSAPCSICEERVVNNTAVRFKLSVGGRGFQKGGTYAFAVSGGDWMDRKGLAQVRPQWYLTMPTVNQAKTFAYSRVKWWFEPGIKFDPWLKNVYLRFSRNLAFDDFLEWVVDRFEFIDNTGNVNAAAPTQIKIYYDSLNEYNKQHNFSTNSTWQFFDEKAKLITTDQVQFVANGDGEIFDNPITSLVRADKDGKYFLIDYDVQLKELKEGALLKFIRPSTCVDANLYYSVCKTIRVNNGVPEVTEGYVDGFDSYMVSRQIPTPIVTTTTEQRAVPGSNNPVITEEVEVSETTNIIRPYSWLFEHHSPSDFWGANCTNRGMPVPEFEGENVICKDTEIALSGAIGTNGLVNYLHYFDDKRKKLFEVPGRSIVSCIVKGNAVLAIQEAGHHFIVRYDENAVRIDEETGRAIVISADKQFGKPERTGKNGCLRNDRNTIVELDGIVSWIDGLNIAHVLHDFNNAEDISIGKYENFLRRKIKSIQAHNRGDKLKRYLHQQINPKDLQAYVTDFSLAAPSFITDDYIEQVDKNETFAVDVATKSLRKFCSFTAEAYSYLSGEETEKQFFSFRNGLPWAHYRASNALVNNFYGVQCQRPIRIAMSMDAFDVKKYVSLATYVDTVVMYSPEVVTQFGHISIIPRNWFKRGDKYWVAPFLCERSKLFDGELLRGRWAEILLIGDPDNLGKYSELTGITITADE